MLGCKGLIITALLSLATALSWREAQVKAAVAFC